MNSAELRKVKRFLSHCIAVLPERKIRAAVRTEVQSWTLATFERQPAKPRAK